MERVGPKDGSITYGNVTSRRLPGRSTQLRVECSLCTPRSSIGTVRNAHQLTPLGTLEAEAVLNVNSASRVSVHAPP